MTSGMHKIYATVLQGMRNEVTLTHTQKVTRLYRSSLRLLDSWTVDRELFNEEATKVRAEFDANKNLPADSGAVVRLLREANEKLVEFTHPDAYTVPYMPGGSKFMRNPPPPFDICFPGGVPPEVAHVVPVDVNYIQLPMSATPEGKKTLLVDFYKKNVE